MSCHTHDPATIVRRMTDGPNCHFFGYYDKCPWNAGNSLLLAHETPFDDRAPRAEDHATVGMVHLSEGNRFEPLASTPAWNFQQGAMLQWLGPDCDRSIIFNQRVRDRFAAEVINVQTGDRMEVPHPVAALSPDGRYALSLNFARLADTRPGYGYAGVADPWRDENCPAEDGIRVMDFETGKVELIISIEQLAEFGGRRGGRDTKHWVNHVYFKPHEHRFCFFHRWMGKEGGIHTRLMTANLDGSELWSMCDSGMVSHFDWRNDEELLAWARKPRGGDGQGASGGARGGLVRLASSPLFKAAPLSWGLRFARSVGAVGWVRQRVVGDRFLLFKDRTAEYREVGTGVLVEDGHCTFSPDGVLVLMDTYPHEDHQRLLLAYDIEQDRRIEIGRFYSRPELPPEIRCDLHARWSRDGTRICIDSTHEGGRQIYMVEPGGLPRDDSRG